MGSTATKDYVSITVGDRNGPTSVSVKMTDDLPRDGALASLGILLYSELKSGVIDDDISFDGDRGGEAMFVLELDRADEEADAKMSVVLDPVVTIRSGELSGAQALAFSAVRRFEARMGSGALSLDAAYCDDGN